MKKVYLNLESKMNFGHDWVTVEVESLEEAMKICDKLFSEDRKGILDPMFISSRPSWAEGVILAHTNDDGIWVDFEEWEAYVEGREYF